MESVSPFSAPYHIAAEQVAGDDEGDGDDDSGDEQLPRPQVALKEEGYGGKHGGDDAANGLRAKVEDDPRHETAHATEQTQVGEEGLLEHSRKAHSCPTDT